MPYRKERYDDDWEGVTKEETGEHRWVNEDGRQYQSDTGLTGIFNDGLGSQIDEGNEWDLDEDDED